MLIDFNKVKLHVEAKKIAAVDNELRQTWFYEMEAKYKKKFDFIIVITIVDFLILMGVLAPLL